MKYGKLSWLALKDMWKHKVAYIVLIVELILMEGLILSFGARWKGIHDSRQICQVFQGENVYYFNQYLFANKDLYEIVGKDMKEKIDIVQIPNMELSGSDGSLYTALGYDDNLLQRINIKLQEGIWLNEYEGNNIPAITTDKHLQIGQCITIAGQEKDRTIEIIGRISNNSYILNFCGGASNGDSSLKDIISHPDMQLILPYDSRKLGSITEADVESFEISAGQVAILKDNSIKEEFAEKCKQYGALSDIRQMTDNYNEITKNESVLSGIISLVFIIISVVGLVGFNGVQSAKNEKKYLIYYFSGGSNRNFVFIEVLKNLAMTVIAYGIFYLLYRKTNLIQLDSMSIVSRSLIAGIFLVLVAICTSTSLWYICRLEKSQWITAYKNKM